MNDVVQVILVVWLLMMAAIIIFVAGANFWCQWRARRTDRDMHRRRRPQLRVIQGGLQ